MCTPKQNGGIGFQDIQAFNLALFAKQAWWLIHNTHYLFYRVYKARYFPNCSFMDAVLGNNPSYVWHSLLAAREIIREGSIWKVGDGRKIEVSTHKWLSHELVFLGEAPPNLFVSELMDTDTMQWNRDKIFDLFAYRNANGNSGHPLQNTTTRDTLIWNENCNSPTR